MFVRAASIVLLALLAACGAGAETIGSGAAQASDPRAWTIGPIIRGRNYSKDTPLHPSPGPRGTWYIDLPRSPGSVHYVTFRHGSLAGKRRIVMRYRIVAGLDVRIQPITAPNLPSIITLYFQRSGDTWTGKGHFETYRWYATFASQMPITVGEHQIVAPLDGAWTAIQSSTAGTAPTAFPEAIAAADQVGFVLGGGDGYGHGVFATGPARLIVTEFRVE